MWLEGWAEAVMESSSGFLLSCWPLRVPVPISGGLGVPQSPLPMPGTFPPCSACAASCPNPGVSHLLAWADSPFTFWCGKKACSRTKYSQVGFWMLKESYSRNSRFWLDPNGFGVARRDSCEHAVKFSWGSRPMATFVKNFRVNQNLCIQIQVYTKEKRIMFTEIPTGLTFGSTDYFVCQHSLGRKEIAAVSVSLWQTHNSATLLSGCGRCWLMWIVPF